MADRSLPDLRTRIRVDDKELKALPGSAKNTGAALKEHLGGATQHTQALEKSLGEVANALGGLPPIASRTLSALESLSSAGATGMSLLGGAALAGTGLLVAGLTESVKGYLRLAEHVENYKRVVGSSAEESGRMVQTFKALGVEEEQATAAMFKLSKAIDQHQDKLVSLGVVVARESNGNVNLSQTLINVADAYNAAGDQTKKNIILFDAFGKSGKDMIPVLEQGSAQLMELEQAAKMTFSDEDLQRAKDYKIQLAQLQQGWSSLWETIGQKVVPVLDDAMTRMDKSSYIGKKLEDMLNAGTISWGDFQKAMLGSTTAGNGIVVTLGAQYDAGKKHKGVLDALSAATQALAAADEELWNKANKLITQEEAQVNAGFALTLANLAVSESAGKVEQAQQRVTQAHNAVEKAFDALGVAQRTFGGNSEEAKVAADNLTSAQLNLGQTVNDVTKAQIEQERTYYAAAAAARKLQEDTDLASGAGKNATKETEAYIAKLQEEAATLAPDSPLRARLQAYIDKLKGEIPANVYTTLHVGMSLEGHPGKALDDVLPHYAGGGRPPVNRDVWVGEQGPERVRFDSPAMIYPNGSTPPDNGSGAGTKHYNLTLVGTPVVNDPDGVLRALQRMEAIGAAF